MGCYPPCSMAWLVGLRTSFSTFTSRGSCSRAAAEDEETQGLQGDSKEARSSRRALL